MPAFKILTSKIKTENNNNNNNRITKRENLIAWLSKPINSEIFKITIKSDKYLQVVHKHLKARSTDYNFYSFLGHHDLAFQAGKKLSSVNLLRSKKIDYNSILKKRIKNSNKK